MLWGFVWHTLPVHEALCRGVEKKPQKREVEDSMSHVEADR